MDDNKTDPLTDESNPPGENADIDERVGYGRPPKAYRFVKGTSGNNAGRPKKRRSKVDAAMAVLDSPVIVSINGVTKKMTTWDAMMHSLAAMAIKGKHKPLFDFLKATGVLDTIVKQQVVQATPRIRVTFPGPVISEAGGMIRTDAKGNVWTNPEGSNRATVLLKKGNGADD